jgi:hypothetical protein
MANPEHLMRLVFLLEDEAIAFSKQPSSSRAENIHLLAECVKSAATAYIIKDKVEEAIREKQTEQYQAD